MSRMDAKARQKLVDQLVAVLNEHAKDFPASATAAVLRDIADELQDGKPTRSVLSLMTEAGYVVTLRYPTSMSLERDLGNLLEVAGLMLKLEPAPNLLQELELRVEGQGVHEPVVLKGRAVHNSPMGTAIEVLKASDAVRETLVELPERMREARRQPPAPAYAAAPPSAYAPGPPAAGYAPAPAGYAIAQAPPMVVVQQVQHIQQVVTLDATALFDLPGNPQMRWKLGDKPLTTVLTDLITAVDGVGVLVVPHEGMTYHLLIQRDKVLDIRTSPLREEDSIETLLVASGTITEEQARRSRSHAQKNGGSLAEALSDLDILGPAQMLVALKTRTIFLLDRLWDMAEGEAHYFDLETKPRGIVTSPVSLVERIFERLHKRFLVTAVQDRAGAETIFAHQQLRQARANLIPLEDLPINDRQRRGVEVILERVRTLPQLFRVSPMPESQTLAMVLTLHTMRVLELEKVDVASRPKSETSEEVDLLLGRLHKRENHYQLLTLHWSAYDDDVKRTWEALSRRLETARKELQDDPDMLAKVQQVQTACKTAFETLRTQASRAVYRATVIDEFAQVSAIETLENQIETGKIRRDIPVIIDACRRILELNPKHVAARRDLDGLSTMAR